MRKFVALLIMVAMVASSAVPANGQTLFKNVMAKKYDSLKTVSCFACHAKVERGTENPKQFRNDFGKLFDKEFKDKKITERFEQMAELDRNDPERTKIEEGLAEDFKKALEVIEKQEFEEGVTYKEAIEQAKLEGLRAK